MTTEPNCPDCGYLVGPGGTIQDRCFAHRRGDHLGLDMCRDRTIARLRAELAGARELSEAERAVVEDTMAWQQYDDDHEIGAPGRSMAPFMRFRDAVLALRALRAKKAGE